MMPIMNGWEFADLLEKDEGLAAIPIVVISAFGDQEYQERPERQERKMNNVRKILRKPIDLNSILAIVAEFCGPGTHVYPERDPC
jgi:CheY-like chemotaxis protein